MLEALRAETYHMNLALPWHGLVAWTTGNVSGRDADTGLVVIKPSGVRYEELTPENLVVTDLAGNVVEGDLSPSSVEGHEKWLSLVRDDAVRRGRRDDPTSGAASCTLPTSFPISPRSASQTVSLPIVS